MRPGPRLVTFFAALLLTSCGLPSTSPIPPEVMVTGEGGATAGTALGTAVPFTGSTPTPVSSLPIPAGYSLWGSAYVDGHLILLSQDGSGAGTFLVAPVPLSTASSFVQVKIENGLGTPYALALVTTQRIVVLEKYSTNSYGCLELFDVNTLISMGGGQTIDPTGSCQKIASGAISGGFLLPLADGVMFLAGLVNASGTSTTLYLLTQQSVLSGSGLTLQNSWTLSASYKAGVPLSGAALLEAVLLPDPTSPKVDIYQVTKLYDSSSTGPLTWDWQTALNLSAPPTLLQTDPSQDFLMAGSTGQVSLFGLNAILNPGGTLSPLGTLGALPDQTFQSITSYTGSS